MRCRRAVAAVVVVLAVAGFLSACRESATSSGVKAGADEFLASTASDSAWSHVVDQVEPDGDVSVATALSAFALAIGPVPGAAAPAGVVAPILSGTLAVDWVLANWSKLTAPQQQSVLTALDVRTKGKPGGLGDPSLPCATADSPDAAPYRVQVGPIEQAIAADSGMAYTAPVYIEIDTQVPADHALMYTIACNGLDIAGTNAIDGCTIHITPQILSSRYSANDVHGTLVHELTHCLLDEHYGAASLGFPAWYDEGVPEWVESVVGDGDGPVSRWWAIYLQAPATSLFERTYSALGFYVHLAESGTNVWHAIEAIGNALVASNYSNSAGWKAAAPTVAFLNNWGSGYAQGRYPGSAWTSIGPNLPQSQGALEAAKVLSDGAAVTVESPAAGTMIQPVDLKAQIVTVSVAGGDHGRITLGEGKDATLLDADGTEYCTDAALCSCPGSSGGPTFTPIAPGVQFVTVTGGLDPGSVRLTGTSLQTTCANPCSSGTWAGPISLDVGGTGNGSATGATTTTSGTGTLTMTIAKGQVVAGSWSLAFNSDGTDVVSGTSGEVKIAANVNGTASGPVNRPLLTGNWTMTGSVQIDLGGGTMSYPLNFSGSDQQYLQVESSSCRSMVASFVPSFDTNAQGYATFSGTADWIGTRQ